MERVSPLKHEARNYSLCSFKRNGEKGCGDTEDKERVKSVVLGRDVKLQARLRRGFEEDFRELGDLREFLPNFRGVGISSAEVPGGNNEHSNGIKVEDGEDEVKKFYIAQGLVLGLALPVYKGNSHHDAPRHDDKRDGETSPPDVSLDEISDRETVVGSNIHDIVNGRDEKEGDKSTSRPQGLNSPPPLFCFLSECFHIYVRT